MHVLFVCTGNICRSPTAERLATLYAKRFGIAGLTVSSAGTRAVKAHPIHPNAEVALHKLGGDSSRFAARQLTSQIATDADLILTMTLAHRTSVLEVVPHQVRRTFTLSEASRLVVQHNPLSTADLADLRPLLNRRDLVDIPDPIGRNSQVFDAVATQIAGLLPPIVRLCRST